MTERTSFVTRQRRAIGDVIVDGLLLGLLAGGVMGVFLLVAGLAVGAGPGQTFGRFDPGNSGSSLTGVLMHLAVSGLYGVGLALIVHTLGGRWSGWRRFGWLLGVVYGLVVWIAAHFVLMPRLGVALAEFPPALFISAHLLYGAVLGHALSRHQPV